MTQLRQRAAVNTGNGDEVAAIQEIAAHTGQSDSAVLRAAARQFVMGHYPAIAEKYGIRSVFVAANTPQSEVLP